jgi:adenosylhomocysteine nucleosidase
VATELNGLPCVVLAVEREALGLRELLRPWRRVDGLPCPAWLAGTPPLLVLIAGVGGCPAVWDRLITCPSCVISAGFAGALRPELAVGDLILASEVVDTTGRTWPMTASLDWDSSIRRGRVLTSPSLIGDPCEKRRLGERCNAVAVEMEAALVAAWCQERGVPFACVRVISDAVTTPLSPALLDVLAEGNVRFGRLIRALLRRPSLLGELFRLAAATRTAARRLGRALATVLSRSAVRT